MVKPKEPPLSVRLSPGLIARVEAWAKRNDITRNAAVSRLIMLGFGNVLSEEPDGERFMINEGMKGLKRVEDRLREERAISIVAKPKPFRPHPKPGKRK